VNKKEDKSERRKEIKPAFEQAERMNKAIKIRI
jgi:hypothetical protein